MGFGKSSRSSITNKSDAQNLSMGSGDMMDLGILRDRDGDAEVEVEMEYEVDLNKNKPSKSKPIPNGSGGGNDDDSALILLVLPDKTTHTIDMKGSNTFWQLYGKVFEVSPSMGGKNFAFVLSDGYKLEENEYNQTLANSGCAPEGSVTVVFT